ERISHAIAANMLFVVPGIGPTYFGDPIVDQIRIVLLNIPRKALGGFDPVELPCAESMTVQIGVPGPVMCEPKGSIVIQSSLLNVAVCAIDKLHHRKSKLEIHVNFKSGFFTQTSCERDELLNVDRLVWGRFLTQANAGKGDQILW